MEDLGMSYLRHREFAHKKMSPANDFYREILAERMAQHEEQMKQQDNIKQQGAATNA